MIGHRLAVARLATLGIAALVLTACSPRKTEDQPAATPAPAVGEETRTPAVTPVVSAPVAATPAEGDTVGGDGSRIQLSGLTLADQQAHDLKGELSCYFHDKANALLLVGSGFSGVKEPGYGLVKVLDSVEQVVAPGGYDAMVNGTAFSGQGKTVTIAITGPATGGGESPPYPATLTYDRADGAKRVFAGTWTCGP
jgi:hypothetical protein